MEEKNIVKILSVGRDMKGIMHPVDVEVLVTKGIGIHIVGLADANVKETLLRTVTALQALGYTIPGKKVIINITPMDIHKTGTGYDLPIAIGILAASGQISLDDDTARRCIFHGELTLDGCIRNGAGDNGSAVAASARAHLGEAPKVIATAVETATQAGSQTQVLPLGFDHLKQVINCLANHERAEDYIIWNRPEWNIVEEGIERAKRLTVIL